MGYGRVGIDRDNGGTSAISRTNFNNPTSHANSDNPPTIIYSDNQSCISLTNNPVYHAKSKHIDIRHHFIKEKVKSGAVEIIYRGTEQMVADSLTKGVSHEKFEFCRQKMGLR